LPRSTSRCPYMLVKSSYFFFQPIYLFLHKKTCRRCFHLHQKHEINKEWQHKFEHIRIWAAHPVLGLDLSTYQTAFWRVHIPACALCTHLKVILVPGLLYHQFSFVNFKRRKKQKRKKQNNIILIKIMNHKVRLRHHCSVL